jgi:hypothetical protein
MAKATAGHGLMPHSNTDPRLRADARGRDGGIREKLAAGIITPAQRNGIMASTPTLTSRTIISQRRVSKLAEKPLLNPPP